MRSCVRLADGLCSEWLAVEESLRQGCVLAPLLFNIFFAVVTDVVYTRFKAEKYIMGALMHLKKKTEAGERGGGQLPDSQLW